MKNQDKKQNKNINISNNLELKTLLRNTEIFNPTLRTFSNFESGLKFQELLYKTKFLVPLISNKKHIGGKMLYVKNEYKTKFYLIFTDFTEINNCFKKEKYQYLETTLDKVSKIALKSNALILLNWKTDNYILNQETLKTLFNKENIKPLKTHTYHTIYQDASKIHPHISNILSSYFESVENLNKAYFLNSKLDSNKYLLLLDINKENLPKISQEIKKIFRKEKINISLTISNRVSAYKHYPEFYLKDNNSSTNELHA